MQSARQEARVKPCAHPVGLPQRSTAFTTSDTLLHDERVVKLWPTGGVATNL